ncbi:MAG: glycoside hydrolase family 32 protein [Cellulomonadaceae bacterium]|nr:glycoside hydrolase family 32 protein [Cellulomonadaceae bacterium]
MSHPDPAFPSLHVRPASGWVNDPNGLSFVDGVYHVFFQHNPASARHGAICWGHVSSTDLVTWRPEPIALRPRPGGPDAFGCWSGTVTLDDGVPTAVYSGVVEDAGRSQVVLARSDRAMREWVAETVPVVGMPDDPRVTDVRDPFVLEVDGRRWAVQGAGLADGTGAVIAYACDDLHRWEYRGVVVSSSDPVASEHAPAVVWECPQLVEVDGVWVLVVSPVRHHGGEAFGTVAWFTGDLTVVDGALVFEPTAGGQVDTGEAFYAPQALVLESRVLVWGWARETGRSLEESDAAGWSGALTFPRELRVAGGRVTSTPAAELVRLRRQELVRGAAPLDPVEIPGTAFEVLVADVVTDGVRVLLRLGSQVTGVEVPSGGGARLLVDGSVVEVFVDDAPARTLRRYAGPGDAWSVAVEGSADVTVWALGLPGPGGTSPT